MWTDSFFDEYAGGGDHFRVNAVSPSGSYADVLKTNVYRAGSRAGQEETSFWDLLICTEREARKKGYSGTDETDEDKDEASGRCRAMNQSGSGRTDPEETWAEKRRREMKRRAKVALQKAEQEAYARRKAQEERWRQEGYANSIRQHQFLTQTDGDPLNMNMLIDEEKIAKVYRNALTSYLKAVCHFS